MSEHPNVTVINSMTRAAIEGDVNTLAGYFTEDLVFHVRGTLPGVGDHRGVSGFLGVIGNIMELTEGDVKLDQLFAIGEGNWAAEWERATLGRKGKTLEQYNSFVYRFEDARIAEMWMIGAGTPGSESFFD
ncbi:MAG: nuclear transport factor 2 family protein [Actinomycetota bacterium]|nr:nuclear transport factor 2 family protein [Actinomycetota bacterium]